MQQYKYCPWDGYRFSEIDAMCFVCHRKRLKVEPEPAQEKKRWEKILYEQQDFDDNYIDETFLSMVQTEKVSNGPDYRVLISKSADIIFAVNSVVIYLIVFVSMLHDTLSEEVYLAGLSFVWYRSPMSQSVFGTLAYILLTQKMFKVHEILSNLKSIGTIIAILLLFSPVMQTVNQTYADDTIYTLTTMCILFHLLMKDYDYDSVANPQTWQVSSSTYASLCFSSLLASRLNNEVKVFIMLFTSLLFFVFAIFLKRSIKDFSPQIFKIIMVSLSVIICGILYIISSAMAFLYLAGVFFITFISPLWIIWLYQYKNTIKGPWDLPKVKQYN